MPLVRQRSSIDISMSSFGAILATTARPSLMPPLGSITGKLVSVSNWLSMRIVRKPQTVTSVERATGFAPRGVAVDQRCAVFEAKAHLGQFDPAGAGGRKRCREIGNMAVI